MTSVRWPAGAARSGRGTAKENQHRDMASFFFGNTNDSPGAPTPFHSIKRHHLRLRIHRYRRAPLFLLSRKLFLCRSLRQPIQSSMIVNIMSRSGRAPCCVSPRSRNMPDMIVIDYRGTRIRTCARATESGTTRTLSSRIWTDSQDPASSVAQALQACHNARSPNPAMQCNYRLFSRISRGFLIAGKPSR